MQQLPPLFVPGPPISILIQHDLRNHDIYHLEAASLTTSTANNLFESSPSPGQAQENYLVTSVLQTIQTSANCATSDEDIDLPIQKWLEPRLVCTSIESCGKSTVSERALKMRENAFDIVRVDEGSRTQRRCDD